MRSLKNLIESIVMGIITLLMYVAFWGIVTMEWYMLVIMLIALLITLVVMWCNIKNEDGVHTHIKQLVLLLPFTLLWSIQTNVIVTEVSPRCLYFRYGVGLAVCLFSILSLFLHLDDDDSAAIAACYIAFFSFFIFLLMLYMLVHLP